MLSFNEVNFSFANMGLFSSSGKWTHPTVSVPTHELVIMTEGETELFENDEKFVVKKGDCLFLHANALHGGTRTENDKVSFFWVHFNCNDVGKLLKNRLYKNADIPSSKLFELMHLAESGAEKIRLDCKLLDVVLSLEEQKQSGNRRVAEIAEWIRINADKRLTVAGVSEKYGYNPDYLSKTFKHDFGVSLKEYIDGARIKQIKDLLLNTSLPLKQIAEKLEFSDDYALMKFFRYNENCTPTEYRNKFEKMHLNKK